MRFEEDVLVREGPAVVRDAGRVEDFGGAGQPFELCSFGRQKCARLDGSERTLIQSYSWPLIFVRVLTAAVDEVERWSLYRHYTIPVPWMVTVPLFGFTKPDSESRCSNEIFEGLRWLRSEGIAFLQVNLHAKWQVQPP